MDNEKDIGVSKSVEFPTTKPLPPIGSGLVGDDEDKTATNTDTQDTDRSAKFERDDDERSEASSTGFDRPGEGSARPRIVRGFRPERITDDEMEEEEDRKGRRSVSFNNGKPTVVKRKTYDGRELTFVTLDTQTDWDWVVEAEESGTARTIGGNDKQDEKDKSAMSPRSASSKHDTQDDKAPSVTPSYQMPYNDEYGIPILDLSSDTDDSSDEEITHKKTKDERNFIPSVGPPNILQYQRESEKHDIKVDDPEARIQEEEVEGYDKDDTGMTHGMFTGNCEFCNKPIKPFPTLEQQLKHAPELLYCCTEYREFVEFVLNTNEVMEEEQQKKNKLISIKPHEHVGSKQERNAAKEKAVQRMRERELQRRQQEASGLQQNFFASGGLSKNIFLKMPGGLGGVTMKDMFGPPAPVTAVSAAPMAAGSPRRMNMMMLDGGAYVNLDPFTVSLDCIPDCPMPYGSDSLRGKNRDGGSLERGHSPICGIFRSAQLGSAYLKACQAFRSVARQMKTINYQLSSQKCLEEGWTLRAPSPLLDDEGDDVFVPEPLNPDMIAEGKLRDRPLIEKFYESGQKFLTMFPDGTGNVFYPSGNLAILISAVKLGQYNYTIHNDIKRSGVIAAFEPNGCGYCYFPNGDVRLYIDQYGGIELDNVGGRKRKWSWKDQLVHVHAPPFQPICIGLNRHLGLRVMTQENIAITFSASRRSCRFNMGSRLKLVAPENAPLKEIEQDHIFLEEKKNHVEALLNKVANLLKFPNHPKIDKMLPPLHITTKQKKMEKMKTDRQSFLAQQAAKDKKQSSLSVN